MKHRNYKNLSLNAYIAGVLMSLTGTAGAGLVVEYDMVPIEASAPAPAPVAVAVAVAPVAIVSTDTPAFSPLSAAARAESAAAVRAAALAYVKAAILAARTAKAAELADTTPSVDRVNARARSIPMISALRKIVPRGWHAFSKDDAVKKAARVSFNGGNREWPQVLEDTLQGSEVMAHIDWDRKEVTFSRMMSTAAETK